MRRRRIVSRSWRALCADLVTCFVGPVRPTRLRPFEKKNK